MYVQNSTACTIVIGYMCTIGAGRTYVRMCMHIIHRVTFRTVAGPYLTNRNDSYQSSSRRVAPHMRVYVCMYLHTHVGYLRIVFSTFLSPRRDATRVPSSFPRLLSSSVSYFSRVINIVVQILVVDDDDDDDDAM